MTSHCRRCNAYSLEEIGVDPFELAGLPTVFELGAQFRPRAAGIRNLCDRCPECWAEVELFEVGLRPLPVEVFLPAPAQ
jgi:hypothetical protein